MFRLLLQTLRNIYYALPVQLFALQLRRYPLLLAVWGIVLGIVSGALDSTFGLAYLFLEPEYLGAESLLSLTIVGAGLGLLLFSYMNSLYINESYRLHFISLQRHPFLTFSLNNAFVPLVIIGVYMYEFVEFHRTAHCSSAQIALKLGALALGSLIVFCLFGLYFFAAGRNLIRTVGELIEREIDKTSGLNNRRVIRERAREAVLLQYEVSSFLALPLRWKPVTPHTATDMRKLLRVLNRNHGLLLLMQFLLLAAIILLGELDNNPYFQLPTAASVLLMLSLTMMTLGAVAFWMRRIGPLMLVVVGIVGYLYTHLAIFQTRHQAIGMNYSTQPAEYSMHQIKEVYSESDVTRDRAFHLRMLERWRKKYYADHSHYTRPKAVFICTSGGGVRSALWTFEVLQKLDSITDGQLFRDTRLITGASGGMIGAAYFRELKLRQQQTPTMSLADTLYRNRISSDLLNRISFRLFTDMLRPTHSFALGARTYDNDRGYAFDEQLMTNLPELAGKRLTDYAKPEFMAEIPPFIITPTILNQGRKLYISPLPIGFLARPAQITPTYTSKSSGMEFRRFFARQDADSLLFASALRMSATFPFVLPNIELPSQPPMRLMDAGAIDNYGVSTALPYIFTFRDWFAAYTERVLIIQIRDNERNDPIKEKTGVFGGYKSLGESKDMSNDRMLEMMRFWYGGAFDVVTFEYPLESKNRPTSLSFHLTQREKRELLQTLAGEYGDAAFTEIRNMYGK